MSHETPKTESPSPGAASHRWLWALLVLGVLIVAGIAFTTGDSNPESAAGPDSIYDFSLANPDGSTTTLGEHEGTPLVVNYFAAWCPPCRRELPEFEAVHQTLGDQVSIVGVSKDNTTGAWLGLIETAGLTYETLFEGNVVGSYQFVEGLAMPTTVFVSAEGEVQYTFSGALNEDSLTDLINEHLLTPRLDD